MDFPIELKQIVESKITGIKRDGLIKDAKNISDRYRYESGEGKRLLTLNSEALAYSLVRMPATFGAISSALEYALDYVDEIPRTLLDVGAGTGAGSWAADALINLNEVTCLERESAMISIGESIMKESSGVLKDAKWIQYDLNQNNIPVKADLVIISYVLNELDETMRQNVVKQLFDAANQMLLIVEPGTPVAYQSLKKIREQLIDLGGYVVAPCTHNNKCGLEENDWCHFTTRIARSQIHKQLKSGDVPYEDEKFSYLAVVKKPVKQANYRILRHPFFEKGKVTMRLCSKEGIVQKEFKKRDGDIYKKARKAKCGDSM